MTSAPCEGFETPDHPFHVRFAVGHDAAHPSVIPGIAVGKAHVLIEGAFDIPVFIHGVHPFQIGLELVAGIHIGNLAAFGDVPIGRNAERAVQRIDVKVLRVRRNAVSLSRLLTVGVREQPLARKPAHNVLELVQRFGRLRLSRLVHKAYLFQPIGAIIDRPRRGLYSRRARYNASRDT